MDELSLYEKEIMDDLDDWFVPDEIISRIDEAEYLISAKTYGLEYLKCVSEQQDGAIW